MPFSLCKDVFYLLSALLQIPISSISKVRKIHLPGSLSWHLSNSLKAFNEFFKEHQGLIKLSRKKGSPHSVAFIVLSVSDICEMAFSR